MGSRKYFRAAVWGLMLLGVSAAAFSVAAWLKTSREDAFRLGADHTPDISIKSAMYDGSQYVWDREWTPVEPNHTNAQPFGRDFNPNDYDPNADAGDATAALKAQCQFGEINNLNSLDASNYGWFCLRIHQDEGLYFQNLGVRYSRKAYDLYGANWANNKITDVIHESRFTGDKAVRLQEALTKAGQSLGRLMYLEGPWVRGQAPADGPAPFGLSGTTNHVLTHRSKAKGPYSGTAPQASGKADLDAEGYYYVYFCVYPDLSTYHILVNNLNEFMPCYLSFNPLNVEIEVTTKAPEKQKP